MTPISSHFHICTNIHTQREINHTLLKCDILASYGIHICNSFLESWRQKNQEFELHSSRQPGLHKTLFQNGRKKKEGREEGQKKGRKEEKEKEKKDSI